MGLCFCVFCKVWSLLPIRLSVFVIFATLAPRELFFFLNLLLSYFGASNLFFFIFLHMLNGILGVGAKCCVYTGILSWSFGFGCLYVTANMPLKCHVYDIFANVLIGDGYVSIYASYELTLINNETGSTGIRTFTLLASACEEICLPFYTYVPLNCHCSLHLNSILFYTSVTNNKMQL